MKDNLFELLLNLFERSLNQIQKNHQAADTESTVVEDDTSVSEDDQSLYVRSPLEQSTRILTYEEQMRLTKASYQFLMRMKQWGIINSDSFEQIMNQLHCSDSRVITLQETKWTLRNSLACTLSEKQLAFLDLVLYQSEDELTVH